MSNYYILVKRKIQGKLKAEFFFQYLKYELRYAIKNLNKLLKQKRSTPL